MAHYKLILAYDGTDFLGFQRQSEGRTVQAVLESALRNIGWNGSSISGAGRTDTGVHANGQVVGFAFEWDHSPENLRDALNANLPPDIAVRSAEVVGDDFHPRYSAVYRTYEYRLFFDSIRNPLKERYAWRIWPQFEIGLVEESAAKLSGIHDFSAFGTSPKPGGSTIRQIFRATWKIDKGILVFEISGNAYLYHMVRRLVNYQVEVGHGTRSPDELENFLREEHAEMVQGLAPARGLFLKEVKYPV